MPKFPAWAKARHGATYRVPLWAQALVLCTTHPGHVTLTELPRNACRFRTCKPRQNS